MKSQVELLCPAVAVVGRDGIRRPVFVRDGCLIIRDEPKPAELVPKALPSPEEEARFNFADEVIRRCRERRRSRGLPDLDEARCHRILDRLWTWRSRRTG